MGHFIKMACECENCKKIDKENNSQSGSIITFVNKLATALQEEFPNKFLVELINCSLVKYVKPC